MAWFTSYLLQPHLKRGRTIDPEKLLPESMRRRKRAMTKEEARRELDELKKSVGITKEEMTRQHADFKKRVGVK